MKKINYLYMILVFSIVSCIDTNISKVELLTKSWELSETTLDGDIYDRIAAYYAGSIYTFNNEETIQIVVPQSLDIIHGTWQLFDKDTKLRITITGVDNIYTIEKIDNANLWLLKYEEEGTYLIKYTKVHLE